MADEKKEKKEKMKGLPFIAKVLIIAIVLILIVAISVGSAFFIASKVNNKAGDGSNTVETAKIKEAEATVVKYGPTVEFGEYTINLNEEEPRYLVVKINFELDPDIKEKKIPEIQASIETKKVILQDRILSILRSKSIADLTADTDFENLRKQITDEANKVLGDTIVKTIRFNNWLIQ